jgi:uncharacterized protein (TIGR02186 family)
MSQKIVLTLFFLFVTFVCRIPALRAETVTMNLEPSDVRISAFYNGADLSVTGEAPADAEVLIRLTGERHDVTLKKKGKVGGLMWMNVAEVTFKNVPSVYLLYTSKALGEIATAGNTTAWNSLGLGFDSVKEQMEIVSDANDKEILYNDFMKMKKHEDLYSIKPDTVKFVNNSGAIKSYSATIPVPPKLKQGAYQIDVIAVSGDRIIASTSKELKLEQVGFPAFLSSLAFGRSLLYGILSVVIAIFGGLGMSMVFSSKGGAH